MLSGLEYLSGVGCRELRPRLPGNAGEPTPRPASSSVSTTEGVPTSLAKGGANTSIVNGKPFDSIARESEVIERPHAEFVPEDDGRIEASPSSWLLAFPQLGLFRGRARSTRVELALSTRVELAMLSCDTPRPPW